MSKPSLPRDPKSSPHALRRFVDQARQLQPRPGVGRLMFALDATASRQPTWDRACHLQAKMFQATQHLSALSIQLCFYRGLDEFKALPWLEDGSLIRRKMLGVTCLGGHTQLGRVLRHALSEHRRAPLRGLVFVGDALEEAPGPLSELAGEMGLRRLPAFLFQEGREEGAASAFATIARLSGGAHCQFDHHSEQQLLELLTTVAVYASGGAGPAQRLTLRSPAARRLLLQLPES
jgi:hypothetical protein